MERWTVLVSCEREESKQELMHRERAMITGTLGSRKFAYSSVYNLTGNENAYRTQIGDVSIQE